MYNVLTQDPRNCTGFWIGIDESFRQMIAGAVNAYLSKPPEPERTTVGKDLMTTEEHATHSTILTTTKPTPAPTEADEFIEVEEVRANGSVPFKLIVNYFIFMHYDMVKWLFSLTLALATGKTFIFGKHPGKQHDIVIE